MRDTVARLCRTYVDIWNRADPSVGIEGPLHSAADHDRNEGQLVQFVDLLTRRARRAGRQRRLDEAAEGEILRAFAGLATGALGWERRHVEPLLASGFREALRAFPVRARQFDPALRASDIYQAARNALTMYCLQSLLGVAVEPTPSVLAYSLLYPYTDNLLDDDALGPSEKEAFGRRLADRLEGRSVHPGDSREARIFQLVDLIEGQYPRGRCPEIFECLLAIHRAQVRSVALLGGSCALDPAALVEIGVEKGGTSVLADGYLVAGALTPEQAECIFGLGVFLQLRDDLEDVEDDQAHGLATVFSARRIDDLDDPTGRALAVGQAVLDRLDCFDGTAAEPVRAIMSSSLPYTIADAAASLPSRYSPSFFRTLERHSPFRFSSLAAQRRRVSRANGSFTGLLEAWLASPEVPAVADRDQPRAAAAGG